MKYILPFLLLTLSVHNALAAPNGKKANTLHEVMYRGVLQKQNTRNSSLKATGTQRRLIANSYVANGVLTDTNHYYYSAGRGSSHSDVSSYYDEFYITAIEPVHNILCDSSTNSHLYSGTWYKTGTRSYIYDANNRIINMLSQSYSNLASYKPHYNSSNLLDTIVMADTTATVPAVNAKTRMYIVYDVNGKRLKDQTNKINGDLYTKREYTYDAHGNRVRFDSYEYDGTGWSLTYRNQNLYDANDRLIITTSEIDFGMGNGLEMSNKDSFAYNGTNKQPYYHKDFNWDNVNGLWAGNEIIVSQYNAANLLDTYYIIRYTTQWDTIERDVYTYDANNLMLRSNGYLYTGNGTFSTTPYDQSTMYYEDCFPAGISNTLTNNTTLTIFPNPAGNIININTDYDGKYNVHILNTAGQRVYTQNNIQGQQQTINIAAFATGTYILQAISNTGATIAQKQFIKD